MDWREWMQFSFGPGILAGIDFRDWLGLLRQNRWAVEPKRWPRAQTITINALLNAGPRKHEEAVYLPQIGSVTIPPPIFMLGHWRSGTTFLHHLLSIDPQFASPNVYQTSYPHHFLTTEEKRSRLIGRFLPPTRPMDKVKHSFNAPNEDEFAVCTATGFSPYMSWVFPRRADCYDRYLTFDGVPEDEVAVWKEAFLLFIRKMTWKHGRPLVLKSPPHTARIRLLLELFPDARFVHIHRNPYAVFQSTRYTNGVMLRMASLQRPNGSWDGRILDRGNRMYDRYFEDRNAIADGRLHELSLEELERDPVGQVRAVYEHLDLAGFGEVEANLRAYADSVDSFQKNRFVELAPQERRQVFAAWRRCFEEWRYVQ